jgi:acyl-CoA synthetase (NDP forming)
VTRDLTRLFQPASVAVVGASNDPRKWGNWIARGALRGEGRRSVYLVNRRGGEILDRPAFPSLADLPQSPELVVVAVPATALESAVDDALAAGARAIVAISAGEADGDAGGARDAAIAARVRDAGALLLGPNCLGVFDAEAELELASNPLPRGAIGMISQSGNLALEVGLQAAEVGLGFSRFVSLGNQADLEAAEVLHALAEHDATRVIALYCEDFRDGRAFARAAETAGKPVVLLTLEHSEATARAVRSHTGALASDGAAIDAACRAAGIERVRSPQELVDLAQALLRAPAPRGRRVAVLADGGGHGGVAAALAHEAGLELPRLSESVVSGLREILPATAATANPIDLAGGGEQDIRTFDRAVELLLRSGDVDAVLMTGYFGGYSEYARELGEEEPRVAAALAAAARTSGRPLVAQTMYPQAPAVTDLRTGGVPVYPAIERAVATLARLAERAEREPSGVPALPAAGPAQAIAHEDDAGRTGVDPPGGDPSDDDAGRTGVVSLEEAASAEAPAGGYAEARDLLAAGGVPFVPARTARTLDEALAAAREVGFPVVLKALGLLHKSDAGGVVLGLDDDAAVATAFADLAARLSPPAFSVERMAPLDDGVELLIGARWDARFGPVALAGLGGVYAEVMRDVAVALAPVDRTEAKRLLLSLRAAPLLRGARGRPPIDLDAATAALAALSDVAARHPEIAEIEVNPLLATPTGALGLDARLVPRRRPE